MNILINGKSVIIVKITYAGKITGFFPKFFFEMGVPYVKHIYILYLYQKNES